MSIETPSQAVKSDRPYTTPSDAISEMFKIRNFDAIVTGAGRVRLTIEGDFQADGCLIYGMKVERVHVPKPPANPNAALAVYALRQLAAVRDVPGATYVVAATAAQMEILSAAFAGRTREWVASYVRYPHTGEGMADAFNVLHDLQQEH